MELPDAAYGSVRGVRTLGESSVVYPIYLGSNPQSGEGNITSDTLGTVAMIVRTFCEENMKPFMDMKLSGKIMI